MSRDNSEVANRPFFSKSFWGACSTSGTVLSAGDGSVPKALYGSLYSNRGGLPICKEVAHIMPGANKDCEAKES